MTCRVLLYCQDSLGLGHLRRVTNIAWSIFEVDQTADVLIAADSPVAPFFPVPPTCRTIKLPTLVKIDTGKWSSPLGEVLRLDDVRSLRVAMLRSIADTFRPDAVLVDHMAKGAMLELEPTIDVLRGRRGVHLVLGLRDILGDPDVINEQWTNEGVQELIGRSYDQILVYGCRDIFDLPAAHDFNALMRAKTTFCGYVVPTTPSSPTRRRGEGTSILVMAGGGHDGYRLMDLTLASLPQVAAGRKLRVTMLTGPFLGDEQARDLRDRAKRCDVAFDRMRPSALVDLRASDLAVSMCGYNTMAEVMAAGKRAVVVPRPGPSAEQTMRARLFDERGIIRAVLDRDLTADSLANRIEAALDGPPPEAEVSIGGAPTAARVLLEREPSAGVRAG